MTESVLSGLCSIEAYRQGREHIFPSPTSLDWSIRINRPALVAEGALVLIGNRRMVNPPVFDAVILRAAHERAKAHEQGAA